MAEDEGFEPPRAEPSGFQDRRLTVRTNPPVKFRSGLINIE